MNNKDILEMFKHAYEFEHERKDVLNSRLSLVLTSLIVIIGAITYFMNNMRFDNIDTLKIVFFILLAILLLIVIFAFYCLFKCLFFYKYRYIARTDLIDKYIDDLKEYNQKSSKPVDIEEKIEEYFKSQYRDAASMNRANNITKNAHFVRALMAIFLASIFVAILAVPFYATKVKEPEKIVYVNVKNFSEITEMSNGNQIRNPFENRANPEPEPEPTLPTPPPPEDISEADANDSDIETKFDQDQ